MKIFKAYKYRIYPTKNQSALLKKHFGSCRFVYNYALNRKIEFYAKEKKTLSRFDIQKEIVSMKNEKTTGWLKEVNSQSLQAALADLDMAYTKFFREKKGFPKFKSKHDKQAAHFIQNTSVVFEKNKLYLMKFREGIKCKFSRKFEGKIKSTTVSMTKTGKFFASILVENDVEEIIKPKPEISQAIGIDLGIKHFLVTSNNEKIDSPKFLKKSLKKLKREQRKLSRKVKGSKNRDKQRLILAKTHEKVKNQREDFLHKVSRMLVDENQVTTYCIETLNIEGMLKNHRLAQCISDAGWNKFINFISYKADWAGKNVLRIGRFEPSSKMCNVCGTINSKLVLSDRKWTCQCGATHDRDFLAACNIRDFAFDRQNFLGRGAPEFTLGEIGQ